MLVEGATLNVKQPDGSVVTKVIPPAVRSWDGKLSAIYGDTDF
jgi:hypothetical protein